MGTSAEVGFTTSAGQERHHLLLAAGVECRISSSTDLHIWDQRNKPEHRERRSAPIYSWEKEGCLAFVETVDRGDDMSVQSRLYRLASTIELITGATLLLIPSVVMQQLFSSSATAAGGQLTRLYGGADRSGCCLLGFTLLNVGTPRTPDLQLQCCGAAAHPCLHGPFRRNSSLGRVRHSRRARPSDDSRSVRQPFMLNRRHNGTPYGMLQCQSSGPSTPLA